MCNRCNCGIFGINGTCGNRCGCGNWSSGCGTASAGCGAVNGGCGTASAGCGCSGSRSGCGCGCSCNNYANTIYRRGFSNGYYTGFEDGYCASCHRSNTGCASAGVAAAVDGGSCGSCGCGQ